VNRGWLVVAVLGSAAGRAAAHQSAIKYVDVEVDGAVVTAQITGHITSLAPFTTAARSGSPSSIRR